MLIPNSQMYHPTVPMIQGHADCKRSTINYASLNVFDENVQSTDFRMRKVFRLFLNSFG
jgi:hypothetical protein